MAVDVLEGLLEEDDEVVQVSRDFLLCHFLCNCQEQKENLPPSLPITSPATHSNSIVDMFFIICGSSLCERRSEEGHKHICCCAEGLWPWLLWIRCSQSWHRVQSEQSGEKGFGGRWDREPLAPGTLRADGEHLHCKTVQYCTETEQSFCSKSWSQCAARCCYKLWLQLRPGRLGWKIGRCNTSCVLVRLLLHRQRLPRQY